MKKITKLLTFLLASLPMLGTAQKHVNAVVKNTDGKIYTKELRADFLARKEAERRIAQGQTLYDFGDDNKLWALNMRNAIRKGTNKGYNIAALTV